MKYYFDQFVSRHCFRLFSLVFVEFVNNRSLRLRLRCLSSRLRSRSQLWSCKNHFSCWRNFVADVNRDRVDCCLFSLDSELVRLRCVQEDYFRVRGELEAKVFDLEGQVCRLRAVEEHHIRQVANLTQLNQKFRHLFSQYGEWHKQFEGFVITDSAINKLRAHGLKLPPALPAEFESPSPIRVRATSAEHCSREDMSPLRSTPSLRVTPTSSASAGKKPLVRLGGSYRLPH
jgi:hypothetical protein